MKFSNLKNSLTFNRFSPFIFGILSFTNLCAQQEMGPTYSEVLSFYTALSKTHSNTALVEVGSTDSGKPLHVFLLQKEPINSKKSLSELKGNKLVLLINNGIHPGESCGIDASMKWVNALLSSPEKISSEILIAIIPVYNIGGLLQQRPKTRANQLGPALQGFRGNAQNLDLNRDFIKSDAQNTLSFQSLFLQLKPELFIDTHTSNGADYQYTMTLISTQKNKLAPPLAALLDQKFQPGLYLEMASRNFEMTPYVNVYGDVPNKGYSAFLETPRYASGYTSLFHCLGFISEAHMLKPYSERVRATLAFLESILLKAQEHRMEIQKAVAESLAWEKAKSHFSIQWELDSSVVEKRSFKGYKYDYVQSALGEYKRLKYFRNKPETFEIDYYPEYKAVDSVSLPSFYVLPAAFNEVVERLVSNGILMKRLNNDSIIKVSSTYFSNERFANSLYEGRLYISDFESKKTTQERLFYEGDWLIPIEGNPRYFLASTLEPSAVDSYLRWGFFSIIFQQKEYFSNYVFEDTASEIIALQPSLKNAFLKWKKENPDLIKNPNEVLDFLYKNSSYYEIEHKRYPIARIE